MKERNGVELQIIVTIYVGRVLAMADIDKETYQVMMLCKDFQGLLDITFCFKELNDQRGLEHWLAKSLGYKLQLDSSNQITKLEVNEHYRNRIQLILFWAT